jgi:hypothetical protein
MVVSAIIVCRPDRGWKGAQILRRAFFIGSMYSAFTRSAARTFADNGAHVGFPLTLHSERNDNYRSLANFLLVHCRFLQTLAVLRVADDDELPRLKVIARRRLHSEAENRFQALFRYEIGFEVGGGSTVEKDLGNVTPSGHAINAA